MVALLHSFVGIAATMVGYAKYLQTKEFTLLETLETFIGIFIGAVTFSGSVVAWGKLQGKISSRPLTCCGWGRHVINLMILVLSVALCVLFIIYD